MTSLPVVQVSKGGKSVADSRDVAAYFGKEHFHVLRDIRNLDCSDRFRASNFGSFKIKDLVGERTSHVLMTKDGFMFLVLGFTGEKAAVLKENYIAAFNAMEAELRQRQQKAPIFDAKLLVGDREAMRQIIHAFAVTLEEQAPIVAAFQRIGSADGTFTLQKAAKMLQMRPSEFITRLHQMGWIYRRQGDREWIGYQPKINQGYLKDIVGTITRTDKPDLAYHQVRVTGKGLTKLAELFSVTLPDEAALSEWVEEADDDLEINPKDKIGESNGEN